MDPQACAPPRLYPIRFGSDQLTQEALRLTEDLRRQGMELVAITPQRTPAGWALWLLPPDPIGSMRALFMRPTPEGDFALASSRLGVPVGRCPFLTIGRGDALACHANG